MKETKDIENLQSIKVQDSGNEGKLKSSEEMPLLIMDIQNNSQEDVDSDSRSVSIMQTKENMPEIQHEQLTDIETQQVNEVSVNKWKGKGTD